MARWTAADMADQRGRVAVVTGANSGIGFHTALELTRCGATVIAACRSDERGRAAVARILDEVPSASVELRILDLADLDSVREFAQSLLATQAQVDLLVNNAAVMAVPDRHISAQGYELQFATNHLGHFALTGLLLPVMSGVLGSRVVTLSSLNHRGGSIHFDDLQLAPPLRPHARLRLSLLRPPLQLAVVLQRPGAAGARGQQRPHLHRRGELPQGLGRAAAADRGDGAEHRRQRQALRLHRAEDRRRDVVASAVPGYGVVTLVGKGTPVAVPDGSARREAGAVGDLGAMGGEGKLGGEAAGARPGGAGCGCRYGEGQPAAGGLVLLGLAALLVGRPRRRRRQGQR